ncbi:MAG: hypothetical protein SGI74_00200 [Oligoflexia bacterium]|nr:hypothetical protein [Oligoflexia bacterium]
MAKLLLATLLVCIGCGVINYSVNGIVGSRLITADVVNHRVLIWNKIPNSTNQAADLVLGQPDFTANVINNTPDAPGTISAYSIRHPQGISDTGDKLIIADQLNNRITIWNTFPTRNHQPADIVLGQPTMTTGNANIGGRSARTLSNVIQLAYDGTHLMVADQVNRRLLIWNSLPTVDQQAADLVRCAFVSSVASTGKKMLITDKNQNRVMIWNTFPTVSGQAADIV